MEESSYGIISLIPVTCVLVAAIVTRRSVEPLVFGSIIGWIILSGPDFLWNLGESAVNTAGNYDNMWIVVVCALFGSIIAVMQKSGGAFAFGNFIGKGVKTERRALLTSWFLGLVIFIDDYMNCLVVGSTMRNITDRQKIPRAALAYIVDATAAPVCLLVPMTTWAVYLAGLIEKTGVVPEGGGLGMYVKVIPYMLYPIITVALTFLFAIKALPLFGPMKKAYAVARGTGVTYSGESSMKFEDVLPKENAKLSMIDFFIPIAVLIGVTIWRGTDLLAGVVATMIVCLILYVPRRKMGLNEFFDLLVDGSKNMIMPLLVVITAFMLLEVNDQLGLTNFVIETASPYMNGIFFAPIVFFIQAMIGFLTGSNWGTWAITIPIVMPLAEAAGVPAVLALGALFSGGGFGSHACPWGDATVLASAGSGLDNIEHVKTQLPYCFIGMAFSIIGFLILSIIMV
ncbi:MAG: hypothetical protein LBO81_05595 [Clostridiales Family XIII bacterium]|jgi:Na+/H+ antiporter NhaC|nr:hypothetical protein [Clostridiales Family XIII bacterium]